MTTPEPRTLSDLATQYGLGESYYDYRGELRRFSDAARGAIISAMQMSERNTGAQDTNPVLPVVYVRTQDELFCDVFLPALPVDGQVQLQVQLESGEMVTTQHATANLYRIGEHRYRLPLPDALAQGYHRLTLSVADINASCVLIITPGRCYEPEMLHQGQRLWGLSIQLYTLRSQHNWGIGDFSDLKTLILDVAKRGCATIGLNPLHALRPADATQISPYSPSNREFINLLYIAVPEVEEYAHCASAQALVSNQQAQLDVVRATINVDYLAVAKLKFPVLRLLYAEFSRSHLSANTARAQAFQSYVQQQGEALRLHALYDVLDQYFSTQPGSHWGWRRRGCT
jgi:hypothetical protein